MEMNKEMLYRDEARGEIGEGTGEGGAARRKSWSIIIMQRMFRVRHGCHFWWILGDLTSVHEACTIHFQSTIN